MSGKKFKDAKVSYLEFKKILRALRESRGLSQKEAADGIKLKSTENYRAFENKSSNTIPRIQVLARIKDFFNLKDEELLLLCTALMGDKGSTLEIEYVVLDEQQYHSDFPSNLHFLFESYGKEQSTDSSQKTPFDSKPNRADERTWTARILRFEKFVTIVTGVMENEHSSIDPGIPETDRRAAVEMWELLSTFGIKSDYGHCRSNLIPNDYGADLVLICGPAHNEISAVINTLFEKDDGWFRGFYFSQGHEIPLGAVRPVGWSIRHRVLPHVDIPFEPLIIQDPGKTFRYKTSDEGYAHDFGLVYVGPNPLDTQHWLILAAGLGPVATYGAVDALRNPRVVELLAQGLFNKRRYCSGLIEYCFRPNDQYDGHISRIALTKGTVYSNV